MAGRPDNSSLEIGILEIRLLISLAGPAAGRCDPLVRVSRGWRPSRPRPWNSLETMAACGDPMSPTTSPGPPSRQRHACPPFYYYRDVRYPSPSFRIRGLARAPRAPAGFCARRGPSFHLRCAKRGPIPITEFLPSDSRRGGLFCFDRSGISMRASCYMLEKSDLFAVYPCSNLVKIFSVESYRLIMRRIQASKRSCSEYLYTQGDISRSDEWRPIKTASIRVISLIARKSRFIMQSRAIITVPSSKAILIRRLIET